MFRPWLFSFKRPRQRLTFQYPLSVFENIPCAGKVGELDTRGSHFYLALYWAEALAAQAQDQELQARFAKVARELAANEAKILAELKAAQGTPIEIGGYFRPNPEVASKAMRPSPTFNAIVDAIS